MLRRSLLLLEPEIADISLSTLESLNVALPTPEDLKASAGYTGDPEKLAPSDRFIFEMAKLPRCRNKLDCLSLKMTISSSIQDIKERVGYIAQACTELRSSQRFRVLIECVLMLGNTLNIQNEEASRMVMVQAFQLDSLLNLANTKGFDKKTSLFMFLEKLLVLKYPEVFDVQEELPNLPQAARESFETIQKDQDTLSKQLESVTSELKSVENEVSSAEGEAKQELEEAAKRLGDFASTAQVQIVDLRNDVDKVKETYMEFLQYFCQDTTLKSDEFFTSLCGFFDELRSLHAKMTEQRERLQRKKEKEKQKELLLKKQSAAKSEASSPQKSEASSPLKSEASSPLKSEASSPQKSEVSTPSKSEVSSPLNSGDSNLSKSEEPILPKSEEPSASKSEEQPIPPKSEEPIPSQSSSTSV